MAYGNSQNYCCFLNVCMVRQIATENLRERDLATVCKGRMFPYFVNEHAKCPHVRGKRLSVVFDKQLDAFPSD